MSMNRIREEAVRDLAAEYGVPINKAVFAQDAEAAQEVAKDCPGSVVLKIVADNVIHKSTSDGVLLGVDREEVRERTQALIEKHRANGHVRGVTVEPLVSAGLELVVGGLHDPGFGHVVLFGLGGVDIESLQSYSFALAPITRSGAYRLINSTPVADVLKKRNLDYIDSVADLILAVAGQDGMLLNEPITELDLNPVIVNDDGLVAVDARASKASSSVLPSPPHDFDIVYEDLRPAIYPEEIAVFGASANMEKLGSRAVKNLIDFGFGGNIYPVSQSADEVFGLATYRCARELPSMLDRAVIALPAKAVPEVLADLADIGARTAHVYTADIPTLDPKLKESGLRVIGPNSIGQYTPGYGVTMLNSEASAREAGEVAFVSQSGTYAGDAVRRGNELGIRFSFVSSIGNCADVSPSEFLAFCEADPNTQFIGFYLEDDRDAGRFLRLCKEITKPVVLMKGGNSKAGQTAAASHTGALSSDPQMLRDIARECGVILVDTIDDLLESLLILQYFGLISGDNLGLVGSGGGVAVSGADIAERWSFQLPVLSGAVAERLSKFAAPGTSIRNPVDIPIWSWYDDYETFTEAIIGTVSKSPNIDVVCAYLDLGSVFDFAPSDVAAERVRDLSYGVLNAPRNGKPLVLVLRSGYNYAQDALVRELRIIASNSGVPLFTSVNRSIRALGSVKNRINCVRNEV